MFQTSAMPPDPGVSGVSPDPGAAHFDDLVRLPPGPRRQAAILEVVAGVATSLAALHERGRAHGGICPDTVTLDPSGRAVLAAPADAWPDDEDAPRQAGYAAFEQYTDDPAYPCGPWTDVYGLAALAFFLAAGSAPPSALARRVRDDYQPLDEGMAGAYGEAFCAAVDRGLAMPLRARPRAAMELAEAMGAFPPPPEAPMADQDLVTPSLMTEAPAVGEVSPPPAAVRLTAMRPEHPARGRRVLPWALACLLLAGGAYGWIQWAQPPVQLAGTPPVAQPAPAAPTPASPAPAAESAPAQPAPERPVEPASGATEPAPLSGGPATAGATADPPGAAPQAAANPDTAVDPLAPLGSQAPGAAAPGPAAIQPAPPEPAAPVAQEPPKAAPVTVRVAVRPWGEVLVNGRSRGVSPPLRELSLAPGRYQVTVRNASAGEHRMTLTVAPGKPAAITHQFE